ncbi:MAG: 50S ribosome-binding GTPase [Candidatus Peribacteria bacterium]|nr:50S ribosome-binding GTPase [Candidatus Peribacteria bacterium]
MLITSAQFIKSASTLQQCPPPRYPEFAFFGRSNVGKSSLINLLTQRRNLAKASNTPGKTRLLNFFLINEQWQIVDLP